MALGATIYKVSLCVSDLDRHLYETFELTIARHPSETEVRMMIRLIAFALNADNRLAFTKGLCAENEPELWLTEYDDTIALWIELGQPDEKRIRKACGRAEKVVIYTFQPKAAEAWLRQNSAKFARFGNLQTIRLAIEGDVTAPVQRSMRLQALIQDAELTLSDDEGRALTVKATPWT